MAALALESQMPFNSPEALAHWFQSHAASHDSYVPKLSNTYKISPPSVDLLDQGSLQDWAMAMADPQKSKMTPRLMTWLRIHEQLHSAELSVLQGTVELGLSTVDFRSQDEFYGWVYDHQQLHDFEDTILL